MPSSFAIQTYTFTSKDTYWDVAGTFYGNNRLYPAIQVFNNITDPINIKSGTVLLIPDKADAEAICNEKDDTKRAELVASIKSKNGLEEKPSADSDDNAKEENSSSNKKVKFVAPSPEDTNFDTYLNADIDASQVVGVKDSFLDGASEDSKE